MGTLDHHDAHVFTAAAHNIRTNHRFTAPDRRRQIFGDIIDDLTLIRLNFRRLNDEATLAH